MINKPLHEIARNMVDLCLLNGCQHIKDEGDEVWITCPNPSCPSHEKGEGHQSFSINMETAEYKCFHCDLKGRELKGLGWLRKMLKGGAVSFPSASFPKGTQSPTVKEVAERKKAQSPSFPKGRQPKPPRPVMSQEELKELFNMAYHLQEQYPWDISDDEKQVNGYFQKRLGIPFPPIEAGICWVKAGTQLSFMKHQLEKPAILFPTIVEGEVVHVHYKLIGGGYYNSPGPKPIWVTRKYSPVVDNCIVITEGVFDALSVYQAGYLGAALLGGTITASHDLSIFKSHDVVIAMDGDEAGQAKVNEIVNSILPIARSVRVATIPLEITNGEVRVKDPNDVLIHHGRGRLRELIETAIPVEPNNVKRETQVEGVIESQVQETSVKGEQENSPGETDRTAEQDNQQLAHKPITILPVSATEKVNIIFPDVAWRGVFNDYRQAQLDTTESPEQYHFGVFKTIAGVVVGRSAFVWSGRKLYPNFYSVLVGPTTKSRKSTAASRGVSLLSDFDNSGNVVGADPLTLILRGLSTPAGLLAQLRTPPPDEGIDPNSIEYQRMTSTSPCEGYRALIVVNEFASLLRQAKKEAGSGIIQLLTDAYDCLPELHNPTKVDPTVAKNATVSMLCLSTREWLEETLELADVFGGYVGRNLFYDWTPTSPIPTPEKPNQELLNKVTMKLQSIRKDFKDRVNRQLEYQFDSEAKSIIEKWYGERWEREYPSEVVASAIQRVDENTRKLALLYAVLENDQTDLAIHANQLQAAIAVGEYWEATATSVFSKFGTTQQIRKEYKILELLDENQTWTKRDLQRKLGGIMSADEFNKTFDALLRAERVRLEKQPSKGRPNTVVRKNN